MTGWELFARYAFPPNELGYCGPPDASTLLSGRRPGVAEHARGFDGAWPYLEEIAAAAGVDDPLDSDVVTAYWVGGQLLDKVDPARLHRRISANFVGQPTGLLDRLGTNRTPLAHHSFHVFVVYPWIRFLDADPAIPLGILQSCRIRWGTVESVDDDCAEIRSRPLCFHDGLLSLGTPAVENVRWTNGSISLGGRPALGDTVAAHWNWICDTLDSHQVEALDGATQKTLELANDLRLSEAEPTAAPLPTRYHLPR